MADRAGFEPTRRFLDVVRPTSLELAPAVAPEGLTLTQWSSDLDEAARAAHADSFRDHWGSEPRTEEEWRQWYTGHRRSEEHTSELQSLMRISYAVFCLKK